MIKPSSRSNKLVNYPRVDFNLAAERMRKEIKRLKREGKLTRELEITLYAMAGELKKRGE